MNREEYIKLYEKKTLSQAIDLINIWWKVQSKKKITPWVKIKSQVKVKENESESIYTQDNQRKEKDIA